MPVFKWTLVAFLLVSCTQGQEPKEVADTSTFLVDPISASTEEGSAKGSFANIPTEKTFHFTACVKDVAVMNSIVGS